MVWAQVPTWQPDSWGWVWQLSYSSLEVSAGCFSFHRSRKGSRKRAEHTVKQTWAPVSQYTEAATTGPNALPRAPRLRSMPMIVPFCPGEP